MLSKLVIGYVGRGLVLNVSFLVGVYAGIFIDQHYQIPKVDNPQDLWDKLNQFVDQYKKDNPGPSKDD